MKNKNKVIELKLPNFKNHYKATLIRLWYWKTDKYIGQQNKECRKRHIIKYGQFILKRNPKVICEKMGIHGV